MQTLATSDTGSEPLAEFLKKAKPSDAHAFVDLILGAYLRLALCMGLFLLFPSPLTFIVAFFVNTSCMGALINLAHESHHAALFRNKRWNDFVGAWLCAYPVGSIYGASRAVHLAHHKYLNTELDPDRHFHFEEDKSSPGAFVFYFFRLVLGGQLWTSIIVNGFLRARQQPADNATSVIVLPKRNYPEILNLIPVQLVIFLAFWAISGMWWLYIALWLLPIFTLGTALGFVRGFIDHARLARDDEERSDMRLITVPNPSFIDRMFFTGFDFEFHAEHHLFPSVPHYYLSRLHRILQADPNYSSRYLLRPSYTSFLKEYWDQICRGKKSPTTAKAVGENQQWSKARKLKVVFVQPKRACSLERVEYATALASSTNLTPPLHILTIAGALKPECDVEIRDENARPVEYETDAEIVGIRVDSLHPMDIHRVMQLAKYFRKQGKTVCLSGPAAALTPDMVRSYCQVVIDGEGRIGWPQFVKDYLAGSYQGSYARDELLYGRSASYTHTSQPPVPRIDLINAGDYWAGRVQTVELLYGRSAGDAPGCRQDACAPQPGPACSKPISDVLKEVQSWAEAGKEIIVFSDDNFADDTTYVKDLLRALIEFNAARKHPVFFCAQTSLDVAVDSELMELLRAANFLEISIGLNNLHGEAGNQTPEVENMQKAVCTVQSYGLWVSAAMSVGGDDPCNVFDEQYDLLQSAGMVFARITLLQAMPNTPLHDHLHESGRLLPLREGLATNIKPLNMTYQELIGGYNRLLQRVYAYDAYAERFLTGLSQMKGHQVRRNSALKDVSLAFRVVLQFLLSGESEQRRFFWKMIACTLSVDPGGWKWTVRYLNAFIYFHRLANQNVWDIGPTDEDEMLVAKAS